MQLFGKDLDRDVVIIAEIGVNHEGSLEAALNLLRLARKAGADAAKFQTFTPERYASASDPARLERVRGFDLGEKGFRRLAGEAAKHAFPIFSTAVSEDVVPLLAELFPAIKIASGDIDFEPVIRVAAATGKPVILSTGLATTAEVDAAVGWFKDEAGTDDVRDRLILMHCVSAYPAPIEEINLLSIPYLAERTGLRVGYSNHAIGPEACLAAVALGAPVIETHFTDRKTGRDFRDHALSCDPDDLKRLVEAASRVRAGLGRRGKERRPSEASNVKAFRKGVVAARDLKAGHVIGRDDLMFARPATEFASGEVRRVIGARLKGPVKKGELIRRDNVGLA
ncbi:MAG: N-acetylneuraminate synthase family protein [Rhodospirillales bacterium]|nr:N-acetylneuraminate synthase family protein [Rhodospirillales bacterium]